MFQGYLGHHQGVSHKHMWKYQSLSYTLCTNDKHIGKKIQDKYMESTIQNPMQTMKIFLIMSLLENAASKVDQHQ
jgi:hypothetical protein